MAAVASCPCHDTSGGRRFLHSTCFANAAAGFTMTSYGKRVPSTTPEVSVLANFVQTANVRSV